ncbi:MAG: colicin [Gammaproteobacteria bacterium]|nr:colicin [Gammaproteobacteria bacterium]
MGSNKLPDWFRASSQVAMLGEISPHVRMVVASLSEQGASVLRFYLDREPTDDDKEQAAIVGVNLSSTVSRERLSSLREECVVGTGPLGKLDTLDGVLFVRMESN